MAILIGPNCSLSNFLVMKLFIERKFLEHLIPGNLFSLKPPKNGHFTNLGAFETEHNLFGCLGLLVEDWFCLTTISRLFSVVTTLTLSVQGSLTSFVLGDLEGGVLVHRLREGLSCFWHVDHLE